jgi:hypothetical protein
MLICRFKLAIQSLASEVEISLTVLAVDLGQIVMCMEMKTKYLMKD